jgi:16S rRNA (cytidine1402-2'-O)-methyltransferase
MDEQALFHMLYLVATPIGNLSDITYRAIETLKKCDYILCEDTRHSQILLKHYDVHKPLKSFHQFSEAAKEDIIIEDLRKGKEIALISDAGTPSISDPGSRIVKRCRKENLNVTAIPGASAAIVSLSCSGLDTDLFQFCGFLPRKSSQLKEILIDILNYKGTSICYESPRRLISVLKQLNQLAPNRKIVIARELTKQFEEFREGTSQQLLNYFKNSIRGEIVLLISGKDKAESLELNALSPQEYVKALEDSYLLSRNEAIKLAAKTYGLKKRDLYSHFHKKKLATPS